MLYTKNDERRYTQMCAEFDKEFYSENRDDAKLFKYCYLIFYMLACKGDFFKKIEYYDGYAQFAATTIYLRFIKKWNKGERIKSILNYAKKTQRFLKIMYQNQEFVKIVGPEQGFDGDSFKVKLKDSIQSNYTVGMVDDIMDLLDSIPSVVKGVIKDSREQYDKVKRHRIYVSIMLSLLNSVTLPRTVVKNLNSTAKRGRKKLDGNAILKIVDNERKNSIILWKLPKSYHSIILVFTNRVRQILSKEINDTLQSFVLPDDILDSILISAYTDNGINLEQEIVYE